MHIQKRGRLALTVACAHLHRTHPTLSRRQFSVAVHRVVVHGEEMVTLASARLRAMPEIRGG